MVEGGGREGVGGVKNQKRGMCYDTCKANHGRNVCISKNKQT